MVRFDLKFTEMLYEFSEVLYALHFDFVIGSFLGYRISWTHRRILHTRIAGASPMHLHI